MDSIFLEVGSTKGSCEIPWYFFWGVPLPNCNLGLVPG